MEVLFTMEKATKNTIKFAEVLESDLTAPKVGTLYVPKATLGELGWKEENNLVLDIRIDK